MTQPFLRDKFASVRAVADCSIKPVQPARRPARRRKPVVSQQVYRKPSALMRNQQRKHLQKAPRKNLKKLLLPLSRHSSGYRSLASHLLSQRVRARLFASLFWPVTSTRSIDISPASFSLSRL